MCNSSMILCPVACPLTLWCLINVPLPAYKFSENPPPPGPYLDPPLINLGKFLFQQLQNIQKYTVNKEYFD